jgi:hypothetical protein
MYAVRHEGDTNRWVVLNRNCDFIKSIEKFGQECLMTKEMIDSFLSRPGLDHRFKPFTITLDATKWEVKATK